MSDLQVIQGTIDLLVGLVCCLIALQAVIVVQQLRMFSFLRSLYKVFCDLYGLRSDRAQKRGRE